MRALYGVLAGAGIASVIACAAAPHQSAMQPPVAATNSPQSVMPPGTHDQIAALDRTIAQQRQQLKLPEPPPMAPDAVPASMSMTPVAVCPAAPPETCHDVCTLGDSICDNATKICDLAKNMPGDAWAEGKCSSATVTCQQAHDRCCSCQ